MVETKEIDCSRKFFIFFNILLRCDNFCQSYSRPITKQPNHFFPHGSSDLFKRITNWEKVSSTAFFSSTVTSFKLSSTNWHSSLALSNTVYVASVLSWVAIKYARKLGFFGISVWNEDYLLVARLQRILWSFLTISLLAISDLQYVMIVCFMWTVFEPPEREC